MLDLRRSTLRRQMSKQCAIGPFADRLVGRRANAARRGNLSSLRKVSQVEESVGGSDKRETDFARVSMVENVLSGVDESGFLFGQVAAREERERCDRCRFSACVSKDGVFNGQGGVRRSAECGVHRRFCHGFSRIASCESVFNAQSGDVESGDAESGDAQSGDAESGDAESGDRRFCRQFSECAHCDIANVHCENIFDDEINQQISLEVHSTYRRK